MALTYSMYEQGLTKIIPTQHLVLGFMVQSTDRTSEMLYAIHPNSRVKTAHVDVAKRPNHHFDLAGRVWTDVEEVPAHAEFIGNYPVTMF